MKKAEKLGSVAARIQEHLCRFSRLCANHDYRNAAGRKVRDKDIWRPTVVGLTNGNGIRINYAPHRDAGRVLSPADARRYLAWLDAGGVGEHWIMDDPAHNAHLAGTESGTCRPLSQDDV